MSRIHDSNYYTNIVNTRSVTHQEINAALDVVKLFIIDKDLIMVGGMAIDLALRLRGDRIYTDDQLPDYDFYSPNHAADAYELASILCSKGFTNISCINAQHITTMRVRVDFETVADITYCPMRVYSRVPTLVYDKLRIVHPHWQMSDQHSSLSIPFENPGREVIFHRWKKDMLRYDKLYKQYPVVPVLEIPDYISDTGITLETKNTDKYTTGGEVLRTYRRTVERENLAKTLEIENQSVTVPLEKISGSLICGWAAIDYKVDGDNVILSIPIGESINVASCDYIQFLKKHGLDVIEYRSEYLGKLPRCVTCMSDIKDSGGVFKKIEISDIYGVLVSAKLISKKHNVWVCNLQYTMMYLLVRIFSSSNPSIVFTAEEQYLRCRNLIMSGAYPSIDVYGECNFTHSYLNSIKKSKEIIYSIKAKQLQPVNMYPKPPACINNKEFNPECSEYFMTDAKTMESFMKWTVNPYPEYTNKSLRTRV
jgi:hypothetical protein